MAGTAYRSHPYNRYKTAGSAALEPERYPRRDLLERPERQRVERTRPLVRNVPAAVLRENLLAAVMIAAVMAVFAIMFGQIISLQAQINASLDNIAAQEQTLDEIRTANDTAERRMEAATDLEYVYQVATEKLGMVYPDGNEILTFDFEAGEFVYQNEDIPD